MKYLLLALLISCAPLDPIVVTDKVLIYVGEGRVRYNGQRRFIYMDEHKTEYELPRYSGKTTVIHVPTRFEK